eukprot:TRINITY_DN3709_c0_g1_i5.p3 TRINITY_DN3709_c0_g1~~TRINITY_DN3709_c0_g1_i5.p3  ORF type:complete len:116 (-),score=1.34 TRINITY_DN3709_c0_g1_i5:60-407(-)
MLWGYVVTQFIPYNVLWIVELSAFWDIARFFIQQFKKTGFSEIYSNRSFLYFLAQCLLLYERQFSRIDTYCFKSRKFLELIRTVLKVASFQKQDVIGWLFLFVKKKIQKKKVALG